MSRRVVEVEPDGGGGRRDGGREAACRSRITVILIGARGRGVPAATRCRAEVTNSVCTACRSTSVDLTSVVLKPQYFLLTSI